MFGRWLKVRERGRIDNCFLFCCFIGCFGVGFVCGFRRGLVIGLLFYGVLFVDRYGG